MSNLSPRLTGNVDIDFFLNIIFDNARRGLWDWAETLIVRKVPNLTGDPDFCYNLAETIRESLELFPARKTEFRSFRDQILRVPGFLEAINRHFGIEALSS